MKVIIQRVSRATVTSEKKQSSIKKGFLVLFAATHSDTKKDVEYVATKTANLRILQDEHRLMNKTLIDGGGEVLVVSQFTLYARTRKGNRPSFIDAAEPKRANQLYKQFIEELKEYDIKVSSGSFGDYMEVELVNDGPVTIIIDSKDKIRPRSRR